MGRWKNLGSTGVEEKYDQNIDTRNENNNVMYKIICKDHAGGGFTGLPFPLLSGGLEGYPRVLYPLNVGFF